MSSGSGTNCVSRDGLTLLQSGYKLQEPRLFQLMRGFSPIRAHALLLPGLLVPVMWAQGSPHALTQRASLKTATASQLVIQQLKILGSKDSVEIEVDASDRITPQTQVLTGPDRLVLDFPNAVPAGALRSQSIYVGAVKDIRAGLFRSNPPITRVVIDLDSPEPYQVFPAGHTVMVKMSTAVAAGNSPAIDPWREPAVRTLVSSNTPAAQPGAPPDPPKPSLEVEFVNGLLSIKADRVTLGEILQAVQRRTGADISLAPGADQEKVVSDLGPAPAQEVLAHLLHGSKFNFLILNAASDPKKLDRVILTPRTEGGATTLPPLQTADQAPQPDPNEPQPMAGPPGGAAQFPPNGPPMPPPDIPADQDNPQ
jgi:AMIN domain